MLLPEMSLDDRVLTQEAHFKERPDGICNLAGFGTQPLDTDTLGFREEGDPAIIRHLAEADAFQSRGGPHDVCAGAIC